MNGNGIDLKPESLRGIADSFDPAAHVPLKLGHEPIKTGTPNLGSVIGLAYDAAKDRLVAKIRPTAALVRKNREGAFSGARAEAKRRPVRLRFSSVRS